jgi:hypothetical protein
MKSTWKGVIASVMAMVLALYPPLALAKTPVRSTSGYGAESSVVGWNLFGPTHLISFSGLKMRVQVRCNSSAGDFVEASDFTFDSQQQSVEFAGDPAKVGGCDQGSYIFLFQIPSGPANLELTFSNLANFSFDDDASPTGSPTVGVMECDDPGTPANPNTVNSAALCTTTITPKGTLQLPDITFKHKGNTEVTFLIPEIPKFPDSKLTCTVSPTTMCHEGQGLTLFLQTGPVKQGQSPVPVGFPTVTFKTDSDLD